MPIRRSTPGAARQNDAIDQALSDLSKRELDRRGTVIFPSSSVYTARIGDIVVFDTVNFSARVVLPYASAEDNGRSIIVCNIGTGTVTVDGSSGAVIHGAPSSTTTTTYSSTEFVQIKPNRWVILS